MAASRNKFPKSAYRFLPSDQGLSKDAMAFELEESDVWNSVAPSEFRIPATASMPVDVPDWSKILKHEYKENRRSDWGEDDCGGEEEEDGNRIPPHEFLAEKRIASSSVQEGIGRTLKGRDLRSVRNAIWQRTGFQD